MRRSWMAAAAAMVVACVLLLANCARQAETARTGVPATGPQAPAGRDGRGAEPKGDVGVGAAAADEGIRIGAGARLDNLTVFAVFADKPRSIGAFTTLERALADGTAEVREVGSEHDGAVDQAQVNKLVIDNRGEVALVVLSGTVVTGGKQDRTIAQDFVVPAGQTADVEAYCVEQHRWDGQRGGQATGGKFKVAGTLANRSVRNASRHLREQTKVWGEVDKVNDAHKKDSQTGTLAATLEDRALSQRRDALAARAAAHLDAQRPRDQLVGLAYAVDGKVRVVRWFMSPELFGMYRAALLRTAALEALTAQAARSGERVALPAVAAADVTAFMSEIRQAAAKAAEERDAHNVRRSYAHDKGYAGSLSFSDEPQQAPDADGASPAKPAPRQPLTTEYSAK